MGRLDHRAVLTSSTVSSSDAYDRTATKPFSNSVDAAVLMRRQEELQRSHRSYPNLYPKSLRFTSVQYCNCSMNLPQSSANSLPSLVNRLGLNIRSQSYSNDLAFSSVSASICLAIVEKRGPLVRNADFSSKWKVTHWKSVNTTAFVSTYVSAMALRGPITLPLLVDAFPASRSAACLPSFGTHVRRSSDLQIPEGKPLRLAPTLSC
jgi:hypothetical protein